MNKDQHNYKGSVLLVDDSLVNLKIGQKMLDSYGINVEIAENGQKAIEKCRNNEFELILMDLEMPEIGGLAAATIIREQRLSYAPIYAVTANEGQEIKLLCKSVRMNGYIVKPLRKERLAKLMERYMVTQKGGK